MDPKKKTKIWAIILIAAIFVAGTLAVITGKNTRLFRGVITTDITPPNVPVMRPATILPGPPTQIRVEWNAVSDPPIGTPSGIDHYKIMHVNEPQYSVPTTGTSTSYILNESRPGLHRLKVSAIDVAGNESPPSSTSSDVFIPGVNITKDPQNPPTGNLQRGSNDNPILILNLTAVGVGATISSVRITKTGSATESDIPDLAILDATGVRGVSTLSGNSATFTFDPAITLSVGVPKKLMLKANIAATAGNNNFSFGINAGTDVVVGAGQGVSGIFPLNSSTFTIVAPSGSNTATVSLGSNPPTTTVSPGETNIPITYLSFLGTAGTVSINQIKITRGGNALGAISNIRLVVDGAERATASFLGNSATANLSTPLDITVDAQKIVIVLANISPTATLGQNFNLGINAAGDIITGSGQTVAGTFPVTGSVFTISAALPDLIPEFISFPASFVLGNSYTFQGRVKNQGTVPAGGSTARMCIDDGDCAAASRLFEGPTAAIAPNTASATITSTPWTAVSGAHVLHFCVDSGSAITESNESNNCVLQTFTPAGGPASLTVGATLPSGQNTTLPAITNQQVKLFTLDFTMQGGDPTVNKLKKIVLEYAGNSALENSKITDLHLFHGDSTEFTVGSSGKDLVSLNKNATNGTIEMVFQTANPATLFSDARNQHLTLWAKINAGAGDNGKKIAYVVRTVEIEPDAASRTGLTIATPEFTIHEDPPDAPTATFGASPASITRGQSTTLTWSVTDATTISIDQSVGTISATGSRSVSPTADTTYILTATNAGGTVTRQVAIAVAQPSAPPPAPPSPPSTPAGPSSIPPAGQTCEQQGLKTYTGPPKPGERVTGMCIPCTTKQYIDNGGSCEVKKKKKKEAGDAPFAQGTGAVQPAAGAAGAQQAGAQAGAQAPQTPPQGQAAQAPVPNLQATQRLVRAPERANTGPETLVYLGILGVVHAGLWLRRKIKK